MKKTPTPPPLIFNYLEYKTSADLSHQAPIRFKPIKAYGNLNVKIKPFYKKITQY